MNIETVTGTLLSAYLVCHRKTWLYAHEVNPCEDNELLDLGRQLHEQSYQRERKELAMPGMKIDVLKCKGKGVKGKGKNAEGKRVKGEGENAEGEGERVKGEGTELIVCEVKKSDRFLRSATMQLCFYLWRMKQMGVNATGEIRIPRKKKIIPVELTSERERELEQMMANIEQLVAQPKPPAAVKGRFCKKCAYDSFCWA